MKLTTLIVATGVCAAMFAQPSSTAKGVAQDRAQVMNRIDSLLAASKTFYLATVDGYRLAP